MEIQYGRDDQGKDNMLHIVSDGQSCRKRELDPFMPCTRISSKWIELPDKVEPYDFKFKN